MRVGVMQLTSSDDPAENLEVVRGYLRDASKQGAKLVVTPEVTNCVSNSRSHQNAVLHAEADDPFLKSVQKDAKALGLWVLLGSLGVKSDPPEPRFANRQFLISDQGELVARYDKLHMFDVQVTPEETWRESDGFAPGSRAVLGHLPDVTLGMTICYDVRFAHLHRALAQAGADILVVPAAFSPATGPGHWEPLLRARAIETGCYVLAPAQTGTNTVVKGVPRKTHGHSLVVSPWGEVLLDAGTEPGMSYIDLDMSQVEAARHKVPALTHDRDFTGPE